MQQDKIRYLSSRLIQWALALLVCLVGSVSSAQTLSIKSVPVLLEVLVDPNARESIESISSPGRQNDFVPVSGAYAGGFGREVHWFRFQVEVSHSGQDQVEGLLLEAGPTYLDDLRFYFPLQASDLGIVQTEARRYAEYRHGDLLPFTSRQVASRSFVQPIPSSQEGKFTAYARLETSSSAIFSLLLWRPADFFAASVAEYAILGLLAGGYIFAILAHLPAAVRGRDELDRPFMAYLLIALMVVFVIQGLAGQYLFPENPKVADRLVPLSSMGLTLAATAYYRIALRVRDWSVGVDTVYKGLMGAVALCLPAPFMGYYPEVAQSLFIALLLVLVLSALRCIQLVWRDVPDVRLLLVSILSTLAGAVTSVLALLGWVSGDFLISYAYLIGILGSVLAMQAVMFRRAHRLEEHARASLHDKARAEAIAKEQQSVAIQQARFIDMLTHELKTPLSVLRMRLGTAQPSALMERHAQHALRDIDAVVDRVALAARLEHGQVKFKSVSALTPVNLYEMWVDCVSSLPGAAERCVWEHRSGDITQTMSEGPVVRADPLLLNTICFNLMDNALKYAPEHAPVRVVCETVEDEGAAGWRLRISNPVGPAGRPDAERVFQKYYRSAGAHEHVGTGLGLYIVRGLCEHIGAHLKYLSDETDVVFEMWLPR